MLETNESTIYFGKIKENYFDTEKDFIIPLLQRNYKWSMGTASVLAQNLIEAFSENKKKTLGLLTLYENNGEIQILDGQQRLISLTLFECQINRLMGNKLEVGFEFERDRFISNDLKREKCIEECLHCEWLFSCDKLKLQKMGDSRLSTDWERMIKNYMSMIFPIVVSELVEWYQNGMICQFLKEKWEKRANFYKLRKNEEKCSKIETKLLHNLKKNDVIKKCLERLAYSSSISRTESFEADCIMNEILKMKFDVGLYEYLFKNVCKVKDNMGGMVVFLNGNVKFFHNITKSEPIAEFLNINQYKTPFVVYDYAKAQMLMSAPNKEFRKEILSTFSRISRILYNAKNIRCWNLVKKGYDRENITSYEREKIRKYKNITSDSSNSNYTYHWEDYENRMKVLFADRYENAQLNAFDVEKEKALIIFFENILVQLQKAEYEEGGEFIYSSLEHIYNFNENTFFKILEKYKGSEEKIDQIAKKESWIPQIVKTEINAIEGSEKWWKVNYFFDGVMHNNGYVDVELDKIVEEKDEISEEWGYLEKDENLINTIFTIWQPSCK